jgi:hypothetical protein
MATKKKRGIKAFFKRKEKDEGPTMEIGTPYGYKQNLHVGFDPATGQFQVSSFQPKIMYPVPKCHINLVSILN